MSVTMSAGVLGAPSQTAGTQNMNWNLKIKSIEEAENALTNSFFVIVNTSFQHNVLWKAQKEKKR